MKQLACFLALLLLLQATTVHAASRNIFDDDWAPPKASDTPRPAPAKPATPPDHNLPAKVDHPPVDHPSAEPKNLTPAPAKVIARRAIPAKEEQAAARKILKEVFADQLIDRSIAARKKLSEALLDLAAKSAEAPADQFVLLGAAADAATEAINLPLAFKAIDRMAKVFEVDGLAVKTEIAAKLSPKPGAADLTEENAKAALGVVDELAEAEDFGSAGRVCTAIAPMVARNPLLKIELQRRQRDVNDRREAVEKFVRQSEKLKASPADATANLEIGRYLCFYKSDWKNGLGALARGNNEALKTIASKELDGPDTAESQVALADAWWEVAENLTGASKAAIEWHAAAWYAKATPQLKGLSRAKAEKRVESSGYVASRDSVPDSAIAQAAKPNAKTETKIDNSAAPTPPEPAKETSKPVVAVTAPPKPKTEVKVAKGVTSGTKLTPRESTKHFITEEERLASKAPDSAEVEVDGKWDKLDEGVALTFNPGDSTTGDVPASLRGRPFVRFRDGLGKMSFKVVKDGVVMLACTDRWGKGGNAGGNWKPELTTRAELERQGWSEVTIIPIPGQKLQWIVFKRNCKAGEAFTYRTEKYNAPFLIQ